MNRYTVHTISLDIWKNCGLPQSLLEAGLAELTKNGGDVVSIVPNPLRNSDLEVLVVIDNGGQPESH